MSEKRKRASRAPGEAPAEPAKPASDSPMDVRLLEQIVRLMASNDLNTVDVRDGRRRVILKRGAAGATIAYAAAPAPQVSAVPQPAPAGGAAAAPADESAGLTPIKAEMVGTFYAAPKPGEKPFVSVGSTVDVDSEVCLIEAMKNYFAVKAGVRGTVAKVLVQDGQTVQFDQPLFLVRPS